MLFLLCTILVFAFSAAENKVCNVFGDPNVVTFDGLSYKFDGQCTYILAMDCERLEWIVYGSFTSCGKGSCLDDISIFSGTGPARSALHVGRGWVVSQEGLPVPFKKDTRVPLSGGLSLKFDGLYLTVFIEDSRVKLTYDGAMSLTLTLQNPHEDVIGKVCGLCGNCDGDSTNEGKQIRSFGNEVEGYEDDIVALVIHSKIDRGGHCPQPSTITSDRLLPCGNDYRLNDAAREACQVLVDNQELFKCHGVVNLNTYYEACLSDFCSLRMYDEGYPVSCSTGSAYAQHCLNLGIPVNDVWRTEMHCPDIPDTQTTIISHGHGQPFDGAFAGDETLVS